MSDVAQHMASSHTYILHENGLPTGEPEVMTGREAKIRNDVLKLKAVTAALNGVVAVAGRWCIVKPDIKKKQANDKD